MILNKKNFFLTLNNNFLFENKPHIAVAVSGGPDSMALAYLMKEWVSVKKGKLLAILINHGIRNDSQRECLITQTYLKELNIDSNIIKIPKIKVLKKNMNEARSNRYVKLLNYCNQKNILHLFIAHHYDDNLETFLIRKVSGSNLEGLGAMNFNFIRNKVQILRPLLNFSKKQILKFNKHNKIKYITDPSNQNLKYTRVVIRNYLKNSNQINYIKKDFENIRYNIPIYKRMLNLILHDIIIKVNKRSLKISINKFNYNEKVIKEKIIEKIFNYFCKKNKKLRFVKIKNFIANLEKKDFRSFNLESMIVIKDGDFLNFSLKT